MKKARQSESSRNPKKLISLSDHKSGNKDVIQKQAGSTDAIVGKLDDNMINLKESNSKTIIPGVPNWGTYLGGGALCAGGLATGGYFGLKAWVDSFFVHNFVCQLGQNEQFGYLSIECKIGWFVVLFFDVGGTLKAKLSKYDNFGDGDMDSVAGSLLSSVKDEFENVGEGLDRYENCSSFSEFVELLSDWMPGWLCSMIGRSKKCEKYINSMITKAKDIVECNSALKFS